MKNSIKNLLPLSMFKSPLGLKIYLNIIPCLIGFVYFFKERKIFLTTLPFFLMLLSNIFGLGWIDNPISLLRLGQLGSLIFFSHWVAQNATLERLKKYELVFLYSSISIFLIEGLFFIDYGVPKKVFGLTLHRFQGPIGESNYSAIALAGFFLTSIFHGRKLVPLLFFILIFLCVSRTGLLICVVGILFYSLRNMLNNYKRIFLYLVPIVFFIFPLIIILIEDYASEELKLFLQNGSHGRLYLLFSYVQMGLKNFFGVGYFNGWDLFSQYNSAYKEFAQTIDYYHVNEQHNLSVQIFSEFGIIGLSCFSFFLFKVLKCALNSIYNIFFPFISLLIGYFFLNGLNDIILHLFIGLSLSGSRPVSLSQLMKEKR